LSFRQGQLRTMAAEPHFAGCKSLL